MKRKQLSGQDFDAMTPRQKQRLVESYEHRSPEERWAAARPLTPAETQWAKRLGAKMGRGRPKLGKGTRVVSVTVEIDLLKRADAYAKKMGLKRAELFTQGLRRVVPEAPK